MRTGMILLAASSAALLACGSSSGAPQEDGDANGATTERANDNDNSSNTNTNSNDNESTSNGNNSNSNANLPCVDQDGDGYYTCIDPEFPDRPSEVDCDDTNWVTQPGGYEYRGNSRDDNCNGQIDEITFCDCVPGATDDANRLSQAIGICDQTVENSHSLGRTEQTAVFGSYFGVAAREGGCMAALSTGNVAATSVGKLPGGWAGPAAGACNATEPDPESSDGAKICDLAQLTLTLTPPPNARGFEFAFMFLSSEWPEYLCSPYNDTFYAFLTSQETSNAPDNVSFDENGNDITVNVGFFEDPGAWTTDLSQTPYGASDNSMTCGTLGVPTAPNCSYPDYCDSSSNLGHRGSGSGWLVTRAPLREGDDQITLTFSIHDEGDDILDSMVLLDGFRWLPTEPSAGTNKDIGVIIDD